MGRANLLIIISARKTEYDLVEKQKLLYHHRTTWEVYGLVLPGNPDAFHCCLSPISSAKSLIFFNKYTFKGLALEGFSWKEALSA